MNYFYVIFLLCAAHALSGRLATLNSTNFLASVKEYPSFLHKCMATFIKSNVLITSAHCLFCEGYCTLFVETGVTSLSAHTSNSNLFTVNYTIIHPDYEPYPQQNDVGLIVLKDEVSDAPIFDLPKGFFEPRGTDAFTFEWKFSDDGKEFHLQANPAIGVSNAMCSLALNKYVSYQYVCALSSKVFSFGVFDNGSPLLGKIKNTWVILGIYGRQGVYREVKIEIFQSLVPYLSWINQVLEKASGSTHLIFQSRDDLFNPSDEFNNIHNPVNMLPNVETPSSIRPIVPGNTFHFVPNKMPPGPNMAPGNPGMSNMPNSGFMASLPREDSYNPNPIYQDDPSTLMGMAGP